MLNALFPKNFYLSLENENFRNHHHFLRNEMMTFLCYCYSAGSNFFGVSKNLNIAFLVFGRECLLYTCCQLLCDSKSDRIILQGNGNWKALHLVMQQCDRQGLGTGMRLDGFKVHFFHLGSNFECCLKPSVPHLLGTWR